MKLTEQCKQDFEEWYMKEYRMLIEKGKMVHSVNAFYNFPNSMKWGVYLLFFELKGIHIWVEPFYTNEIMNGWVGRIPSNAITDVLDRRGDVCEAAVERANNIYNEKFK
jgi:hypothetical protein